MLKRKLIISLFLTMLTLLCSCTTPLSPPEEIPPLDDIDHYLERHQLDVSFGRRKSYIPLSKNFESNIKIKNFNRLVFIISNIGKINDKNKGFEIRSAHYANDILKIVVSQEKWAGSERSFNRILYHYYFLERGSEWELFDIKEIYQFRYYD